MTPEVIHIQSVPSCHEDTEKQELLTSSFTVGKIYYRTGVAFKELDDKARARKLLRVAAVYLPRDEHVKRELAACALRLG